MGKPVNKTLVGSFLVSSVVLFVSLIIWAGSGRFFTEKVSIVMYFEGSVTGLSVGSPLVFRGVKIGSVTDILILADVNDLTITIPVIAEIEKKRITIIGKSSSDDTFEDKLKQHIDRGLRAQLSIQSLVTGSLIVELDFHPDKESKTHGSDMDYVEIPTIAPGMRVFAEKIEKVPIEEIYNKLLAFIEGFTNMASTLNLKIDETLNVSKELMVNMDSQVAPLSSDIHKTLYEVREFIKLFSVTLLKAQKTIETIELTIGEDSSLVYQLRDSLESISATMRSLRKLSDNIDQNPESLIRGKREYR